MEGKSTYKVPKGKLLKVTVKWEGNRLEDVKIMGDFFMHPESAIRYLEESLKGSEISDARGIIEGFMDSKEVKVLGFDAESLFKAIKKAMGD